MQLQKFAVDVGLCRLADVIVPKRRIRGADAMGLCKLRRVIPEQIRADVRLSGVIVGHCHMELRAAHCAMDAAVRLGGLLQIQRQNRAEKLVRLALSAQEFPSE